MGSVWEADAVADSLLRLVSWSVAIVCDVERLATCAAFAVGRDVSWDAERVLIATTAPCACAIDSCCRRTGRGPAAHEDLALWHD